MKSFEMFQRQDKQNKQGSQKINCKKILKETRQKNQTGLTEKETEVD